MFPIIYWSVVAAIGVCACAAGIWLYRLWVWFCDWRNGNGLR